MLKINRRAFAAGSAALALAAPRRGRPGQEALRFVQNGNLTILDPIWTTAYVTRDHGYMIYDTLFATDESNAVKPQMVDSYEVSADKLTWTFTLRDGLEWHDGKPVTAEDCVASLKRWGARDPMGQKLMDFVAELKAVDDKTFTLKLKEPYGLVLDTLGKPSSNVPFMMPKRIADTDPFKQIDSQVGSGPFIYVNAESKPGEKHVYVRNPKYKPRAEPASGLAGGKIAKVDRVEFIDMPDPQQQVNALIAGEIDMVEQVPHDLIPLLKKDKGVQIGQLEPARPAVRHPLQPPDQAVRQSQDPAGRALFDAPGGLPQGDGRRPAVLQGLHRRLRLRHAQRRRDQGRPAGQARLREVQGAAEGGRLRRLAGGADAVDRRCRC